MHVTHQHVRNEYWSTVLADKVRYAVFFVHIEVYNILRIIYSWSCTASSVMQYKTIFARYRPVR